MVLVRALAFVLAVAVPAAGLASLHHATSEAHAICAEHGHVVHDDADRSAGLGAAEQEHEHCALDQVSPKTEPPTLATGELSQPRGATALVSLEPILVTGWTFDVLSSAPKQSPPLS